MKFFKVILLILLTFASCSAQDSTKTTYIHPDFQSDVIEWERLANRHNVVYDLDHVDSIIYMNGRWVDSAVKYNWDGVTTRKPNNDRTIRMSFEHHPITIYHELGHAAWGLEHICHSCPCIMSTILPYYVTHAEMDDLKKQYILHVKIMQSIRNRNLGK